jgi:hypothetical protein
MMHKPKFELQITPLIIAYLSTFIFEAPLRYFLFLRNFTFILYLRDAIPIVYLLLITFKFIFLDRKLKFFLIGFILLFYMMIGVVCTGNILQVIFGIKIFIPFFLGITLSNTLYKSLEKYRYLFLIFFILVCCGVIINVYIEYPWIGFAYDIGDSQIEGVRKWTTFGIARLSGLARSSIDAAIHISILYICVIVFFKKKLFHIVLLPLAATALLLTTTKGATLSFILVVLAYVLTLLDSSRYLIVKKSNFLLFIVSILCLIIPVFSLIIFQYITLEGQTLLLLFSSWQDRLEIIWPQALELLNDRGSLILGRGIGGIGTAQKYFEPHLYNPGDSLFVYFYCSFGIPSILFFIFLMYKCFFLDSSRYRKDLFTLLILIFLISYGFTTAVVESSFATVFLGLTLRHLYNLPKELKLRKSSSLVRIQTPKF